MSDAGPIPVFLKRQPGASMTTPTPEPPKKRTVRPDAIVATITVYLPVDKDSSVLFRKGSDFETAIDTAVDTIRYIGPEGIVVTATAARVGKVPDHD